MSHSHFLCVHIVAVIFVWSHLNRHILYHFKSVALKSYTLYRVVGEQTQLCNAKLAQNVCTYAIVALIGLESEMQISFLAA